MPGPGQSGPTRGRRWTREHIRAFRDDRPWAGRDDEQELSPAKTRRVRPVSSTPSLSPPAGLDAVRLAEEREQGVKVDGLDQVVVEPRLPRAAAGFLIAVT